jgi:hypothetical protein
MPDQPPEAPNIGHSLFPDHRGSRVNLGRDCRWPGLENGAISLSKIKIDSQPRPPVLVSISLSLIVCRQQTLNPFAYPPNVHISGCATLFYIRSYAMHW